MHRKPSQGRSTRGGMIRPILGLIAALVATPVLAAASPDCSRKDTEIPATLMALRDCVFGTAEPMGFNGDAAADAVADAAIAACPAQHEAALSYAKACDTGLASRLDTVMRGAVVDFVGQARLPRADRLWSHGEWHKGACALDNPDFKAVVYAHMDCVRADVLARIKALKPEQEADLAGLADDAIRACAAKEAPVRKALGQCVSNADALTASYRAGAAETVLSDMIQHHVRGEVLNEEQQKDEKLLGMISDYGACVAFEAHARRGKGAAGAAREEAIRVCGLDRLDLHDAIAIALPQDQRQAVEQKVDMLAMVEASLELPEDSAAAAPATGLATRALAAPRADAKCGDAVTLGEHVMAVRECVMAKADALAMTDAQPAAIADQAMAACAAERGRLADYQKQCRLNDGQADETARKAIEREVAERRLPRADRMWLYANDWAKGACSPDDKAFEALTHAHLECMVSAAAHDTDPNISTIGASVRALPKCMAQEARVAAQVRSCAGPRADAVMDGYRAWAKEAVTVIQLDTYLDDKARAALPEMKGTDYFDLLEIYVACVALEAYDRHGKGSRDAILDQAAAVCEASRQDVAYQVTLHTPKDQQEERLAGIERTARRIAASGLDELDGKPAK